MILLIGTLVNVCGGRIKFEADFFGLAHCEGPVRKDI